MSVLMLVCRCRYQTIDEFRAARTKKDLRFIATQMTTLKRQYGHYPKADLQKALGFKAPLQDAWGAPYRYEISADGQHYRLISAGADRVLSPARPRQASDDIALNDGVITR